MITTTATIPTLDEFADAVAKLIASGDPTLTIGDLVIRTHTTTNGRWVDVLHATEIVHWLPETVGSDTRTRPVHRVLSWDHAYNPAADPQADTDLYQGVLDSLARSRR